MVKQSDGGTARIPKTRGRVTMAMAVPVLLAGAAAAGLGGTDTMALHETVESAALSGEVPAQADPKRGERRFGEIGCIGCHTVNGVGGSVGPDLTGVGSRPSRDAERWRTTEEYLRASLLDPGAYVVPGFTPDMPAPDALGLSQKDIDDLIAYLLTLQ